MTRDREGKEVAKENRGLILLIDQNKIYRLNRCHEKGYNNFQEAGLIWGKD